MRLVEIGVFPTETEMGMWQANCETIKLQIDLKNTKSMAELGKDAVFAEIVNTVVERMPRDSDIFRSSAIKSKQDFADIKEELLSSLFTTLGNILRNPQDFEFKNSDLDSDVFLEVITLFLGSPEKHDELTKFLQNILKVEVLKKADIEAYFDKVDWIMTELGSLCQQNKENFDKSPEKFASIIVEYLVTIGSISTDIKLLTIFLEKNSIKVSKKWIERIPNLFDEIIDQFDYPTLFDVATVLDAFPLRKVFQARTFALQSLIQAFIDISKFFAKDQNAKNRIWQEVQKSERFVEFMHVSGHDQVLKEFSKDYSTIVKKASENAENETVERLRKCGYSENLGSPSDPVIRSQIDTIIEVLPHLSPQFAHLALRHYSYITSDALSSLLSREQLPIELLRLENFDFSSFSSNSESSSEWPPLDFTASDEIEKSVNEERNAKEIEARKKREKGNSSLFSFAPPSDPQKPVYDEKAILKKKAEEYKARVMAQLRAIRPPPKDTAENGEDGEILVPMATSKTFSALNSLKISKADEIAIRPSYDKYRYETPNDDGMYDDEYDDEFDTREFNIERLNEELESSSEEEDAEGSPDNGNKRVEAQPQGGNSGIIGNNRGVRGRGRGRGGRGGHGPPQAAASGTTSGPAPAPGGNQQASDSGYTGGRARQMKERHKSDYKQRGADKKRRGGMI